MPETSRTDWQSIGIGSAVCFLATVQHAVYVSSMWPYLITLLPTAREDQFGYTIMASPLFLTLVSPLYGLWCNRTNRTKMPAVFSVIIMALGNAIYLLLPLKLANPLILMGLSRAVLGCGGGIFTATRVNAVVASTPADRSRALSANSSSFALGCCAGPALQLLFNPLGYPGIPILGSFGLNLYTGPAYAGILCCVLSLVLLFFYWNEDANKTTEKESEGEKEEEPSFDRAAAAVCIYTRFVQYFVFALFGGIGTSYGINMFAWTKERAVFWMSVMYLGASVIQTAIAALNIFFNVGVRWNQRRCALIGLGLLLLFPIVSFQWWFLPGSVPLQAVVHDQASDSPGCGFSWCASLPSLSPHLFVVSFVLFHGVGFALINIYNGTIFSFVVGPRKQGIMQSYMTAASGAAHIIGPVVISWFYVRYGPRPAWLLEMASIASAMLLYVLFRRQLVPLQAPSTSPPSSVKISPGISDDDNSAVTKIFVAPATGKAA